MPTGDLTFRMAGRFHTKDLRNGSSALPVGAEPQYSPLFVSLFTLGNATTFTVILAAPNRRSRQLRLRGRVSVGGLVQQSGLTRWGSAQDR
jgi:hypothetical protein